VKKTILPLICFLLLACSSDKETSTIPENLIGSWKLVGYYDDMDNDPVTGTNLHLVENGEICQFNANGTFDIVGDEINPDGTFTVNSNTILTRKFYQNSSNPNMIFKDEILILSEDILQISCSQEGAICNTLRYEKL
jgi:hypothetical protein